MVQRRAFFCVKRPMAFALSANFYREPFAKNYGELMLPSSGIVQPLAILLSA